jgi:hypothetical protein
MFVSDVYVFKPKKEDKKMEDTIEKEQTTIEKEKEEDKAGEEETKEEEKEKEKEKEAEEEETKEKEETNTKETKKEQPHLQGMYNLITFGKFENRYLKDMLRDRKYCQWLGEQEWFKTNYEYLYNSIKNYNPREFFLPTTTTLEKETSTADFIQSYKYFNLLSIEHVEQKVKLEDKEKKCYIFYLDMIENLKKRVEVRKVSGECNPYDIKAPVKWLQEFENKNKIPREEFKEFLYAYDLPNITSIVEEIRKEGGLDYNGGKSYIIGKKRSADQENFWGVLLKRKYTENISSQFKYLNCIFDFLHIPGNTIYECKLALKDFNEEQFVKYEAIMNRFNIIYLIGYDCVINMDLETIYTTDLTKYVVYQCNIPTLKVKSKFDDIIFDYDIVEVEDFDEVL